MADRTISVSLRANTGAFSAQMAAAGRSAEVFGGRVNQMSGEAQALTRGAGLAFVGFGVAVAAGFGAAVVAAARFETEMRNAATISQATRKDFDGMSATVLAMSTRLPQSATEIAAGFYDIASSGFDGAAAVEVLDQSAKAASAGLTDTATSAQAVTAVLNAYGMGASEARKVSDVLFQTVNLGVITFEDLAQNIGDVVPWASQLGVPLEDVGTALATITLQGVPAAEAATQLKRLMIELIDPSEEMAGLLRELGYESGVQAIEQDGLRKVILGLWEATNGNITAFQGLFPEMRAGAAALALVAQEGELVTRIEKDMATATQGAGATARALKEQSQALGFQLDVLKNQVIALAIQLGTALMPVVKSMADFLGTLVVGFDQLPGPVQTLGAVLGGTLGLLALFGGGFLLLAPKIIAAREAVHLFTNTYPRLSSALGKGALALGVVGIGVAAVALILGQHAQKTQQSKARVDEWTTALRAGKKAVDDLLAQKWADLGGEAIDQLKQAGIGVREWTAALESGSTKSDEYRKVQQALREEFGFTAGAAITEGDALLHFLDREIGERGRATEGTKRQKQAKDELNETTSQESDRLQQLGIDMEAVDAGTQQLTRHQEALKESLEGLPGAFDVYTQLLQDAEERQRGIGEFSGLTGGELDLFVAGATVSLNEFSGALEAQNADVAQWQTDLVTVAGRAGSDVAAHLASMGFEGRRLVSEFATGSAEDVARAAEAIRTSMGGGIMLMVAELDTAMKIAEAIVSLGAGATVQAIADKADVPRQIAGEMMTRYNLALDDGQRVAAVIAQVGAGATVDQIAFALGRTPEEVRFIMAAYGIELQAGVGAGQITGAVGAENTKGSIVANLFGVVPGASGVMGGYAGAIEAGVNSVISALGGQTIGISRGGPGGRQETAFGMAHGGIFEDHSPAIFPGGPIRFFAEPETHKESYIPWAMDRRGRATDILAQTAAGFGFQLAPRSSPGMAFRQGGILDPVRAPAAKYPGIPGPSYESQLSVFGVPGNFPEGSAAGMNVMYRRSLEHAEAVSVFLEAQRQQAAAAAAAAGGFTGRGGSAQVEAWVREALTIMGAPMEWLGPVAAKAMQESGGNPRAINLWDSNAAAGIPSKGLLQTIDPTFNAYKLPGYGDIWNPVHNAIAAIRYMVSRYGSPFNLPSGGYAMGGIVDPHMRGSLDGGGELLPGWNLAFNGLGRPEPVGAAAGGTTVQTTIHFNAPIYGDEGMRQVAHTVVDERDRKLEFALRRQ